MISTQVEVVAEAGKTDGRRKSMAVLRKDRQYKRIVSRKISVYASAIRNPAALTASLASLWSAAATVAAALRITFARTLVLGVSVAATVQPALRRVCLRCPSWGSLPVTPSMRLTDMWHWDESGAVHAVPLPPVTGGGGRWIPNLPPPTRGQAMVRVR